MEARAVAQGTQVISINQNEQFQVLAKMICLQQEKEFLFTPSRFKGQLVVLLSNGTLAVISSEISTRLQIVLVDRPLCPLPVTRKELGCLHERSSRFSQCNIKINYRSSKKYGLLRHIRQGQSKRAK